MIIEKKYLDLIDAARDCYDLFVDDTPRAVLGGRLSRGAELRMRAEIADREDEARRKMRAALRAFDE